MKIDQIKSALLLLGRICLGFLILAAVISLTWNNIKESARCPDCHIILKESKKGFSLLIDDRDRNDGFYFLQNGELFGYQEEAISKILRPGDIAVDVGAGFGYYTMLMANLVKNTGMVYAFEARMDVANLLYKTVGLNFFPNVQVYNLLLYRKAQPVILETYDDDFNTSAVYETTPIAGTVTNVKTFDAQGQALDAILHDVPEVSLLRINNYGGEFEVLQGARSIIQRSPRISILLQFNTDYFVDSKTAWETVDNLYDMGFEFWHLEPGGKKVLLTRDRLMHITKGELLITRKAVF